VKHPIPPAILTQHLAVLGKTGSGKTSTAKLAIEQVVAEGARVCVLDPIKSDWWGLTSSANGKHAGLPFHILGGPRGHVPLHSSAGKAIGEIVASGALPLSIIDMADFEPGGQAKFFVDFAPTLIRKMRGVVYLVIEEAHLFAPKERSGVGAENLSIHWSKTLATAGRSKGIRLVVLSQRVQALHNAVLGSCDTLIAHRLTTPADQEPVVKWLKANTTKDVLSKSRPRCPRSRPATAGSARAKRSCSNRFRSRASRRTTTRQRRPVTAKN
jgi:DNA helicase HerA-like ATPase